jgi:hypothetical protein
MTNETAKALMMIAMFGGLEVVLYLPRIHEAAARVRKGAARLLMPIAAMEQAVVAVRVRRRAR